MMQRPAADFPADAGQCLWASGGLKTVREDAPVRLHPHHLSGSKLEAEKVKVDVRKVAAPVDILAVDDLRLIRMQHQLAGRQAVGNCAPECPRLPGALAMATFKESARSPHTSVNNQCFDHSRRPNPRPLMRSSASSASM